MDNLGKREVELVALGASLISIYVPCISYHIGEAKECELAYQQIKQAIEIAARIKNVPADRVQNTTFAHVEDASETFRSE